MEDRGNVEKKKEKETAVPRQARYNKYDQHDNKWNLCTGTVD